MQSGQLWPVSPKHGLLWADDKLNPYQAQTHAPVPLLQVVSIDTSVNPASYGILVGDAVRETESPRLAHVPECFMRDMQCIVSTSDPLNDSLGGLDFLPNSAAFTQLGQPAELKFQMHAIPVSPTVRGPANLAALPPEWIWQPSTDRSADHDCKALEEASPDTGAGAGTSSFCELSQWELQRLGRTHGIQGSTSLSQKVQYQNCVTDYRDSLLL